MRKERVFQALREAEISQRGVIFYLPCGNCGGVARFEYDPYEGYAFAHRAGSCLEHESYSRAAFVTLLAANARQIYKIEKL